MNLHKQYNIDTEAKEEGFNAASNAWYSNKCINPYSHVSKKHNDFKYGFDQYLKYERENNA